MTSALSLYRALTILFIFLSSVSFAQQQETASVVYSDIELFWRAYDKITQTKDSSEQRRIIVEEYLNIGSPGLTSICQVRNYTADDYLAAIHNYPKFWTSIRPNTLKAKELSEELKKGLDQLKAAYPKLKPATIYFTIGAFRTNGTTLDDQVLIGSELAMADENTITEEFPERMQGLRTYFNTNPIEDVVLLFVHEFVHTQQKPMVHNLLSQTIYEGVGEFVSTYVMQKPSASPAIEFGKNNPAVREAFEREMFYMNNQHEWLYSNAPNDFGIRDLGYYIGYQMCENYLEKAKDKQKAIHELIELDYENEQEIEAFVNGIDFFTKPLNELYEAFEASRPSVLKVIPVANNAEVIDASTDRLTIVFSEPIDTDFRNFDYGPLGADAAIQFKKEIGYNEEKTEYSFEIQVLKPGKRYQLLIGSGFRNLKGIPLKPFLIDFKTK